MLAGVNRSTMETQQSDDNNQSAEILSEFESQSISMLALVRTLLSPSTMPHIVLISLISSLLYILSGFDSLTVICSIAFTSLAISYSLTALLSSNPRIREWITYNPSADDGVTNFVTKQLKKFKICLFPLSLSVFIWLVTASITGNNGIIANTDQYIPLFLGMLFIAWSVVQGTSFSKWASAGSAKKTANTDKFPSLKTTIVTTCLIVTILAMTLGFVFYQIDDLNNSVAKSAISALPFCALAVTVTGMSVAYSWAPKKLASMKPRLQSFSSRWTLTCHVFIVWHLLTIWRQSFLSPATYQVIFEEILLMVFTVFVAIWSMTSKGYRSKFRLITEENALTWGLAFGYAYAGSVAMLVTFFDDIKTVMVFGHSVVVITVIFTHRLVLTRIINTDNTIVEVNRILTSNETTKNVVDGDNNAFPASDKTSDTPTKESESWQEDSDVDWDAQKPQEIPDVDWDQPIDLD